MCHALTTTTEEVGAFKDFMDAERKKKNDGRRWWEANAARDDVVSFF